ncbi:hypothetical protein [Aequorivita sinensis]|uniref:hypothetical protein n=1 Tax=Aequorivita sinensis TaxID=1382458 RepID=UPI001120AD4E|nr:hypothetical protein [Aequorivita sinensis]
MTKFKNKNKILIGLSVLILLVSFIGFWKTNEKRKIDSEGYEVIAEVVYCPENCATINYRLRHCKLKYNNKIFVKDIDLELCQLISEKEEIKMLTNKTRSRLLFEGEYESGDFLLSILLVFVAFFGLRQGFKGLKN